jgi:hypothetical protein
MFAHLIMNSNEYPSCPLVKPLQAPVNESPSIQFVSKQAVDPSAPISTALAALEGWAFKLQYGEPNLTHDGVIINVQSLQTDLSDGTNFVLQSRIADIRYISTYHRPCSPSRSPKHRREVQAFAAFRVELVRLSRQLKRVHSKSAVRTAGQSAEILSNQKIGYMLISR